MLIDDQLIPAVGYPLDHLVYVVNPPIVLNDIDREVQEAKDLEVHLGQDPARNSRGAEAEEAVTDVKRGGVGS